MKITGFIAIGFSVMCSTAACSDDPAAVANPDLPNWGFTKCGNMDCAR